MAEYIKKSDVLAYPIRRQSYDKANGNAHFISGVESVMEFVEGLPAADVAKVRHGYWIDHHSGGGFCSACKRWVPYSHHPKYCETCGARMDKEAEHEAD
jgi:hypothetical protein